MMEDLLALLLVHAGLDGVAYDGRSVDEARYQRLREKGLVTYDGLAAYLTAKGRAHVNAIGTFYEGYA